MLAPHLQTDTSLSIATQSQISLFINLCRDSLLVTLLQSSSAKSVTAFCVCLQQDKARRLTLLHGCYCAISEKYIIIALFYVLRAFQRCQDALHSAEHVAQRGQRGLLHQSIAMLQALGKNALHERKNSLH